jgi:ABC-type branched-subunit amino acid transport system substrate-binding protein
MSMSSRALAAVVALGLAGCGSTVQVSSTATGGANDLGTTGAVTDPLTGQPAGTTGAVSGTTGAVPGVRPGTTGAVTPGAGTSTGGTTAQPSLPTGAVSGRGFTATTIKLGYATADDYNTFVGGLGLSGLDVGDPKAQMKAVVDDINRRGGIAGRKIVLVPHNFNTAQAVGDPQTANQAACATWTQDDPVFAVVLPAIVTDNLLECLHKAHTPLVHAGLEFPRKYGRVYTKYPSFFHIGAMVGERFDSLAIDRIYKRGYFQKWDTLNGRAGGNDAVRIGVIVRNNDEGAVQEQSYRRELAKHGLKPYSVDHCTSNIDAASCMQSVQLRYQTARITHVMGNSDLNFMNAANAQQYHPRYFMVGSYDLFAQNAPKAQLTGAMGEGFMPTADVPQAKDPGPPTSATTACLSLMRRAGQNPSGRGVQLNMESTCDALSFVKAAIDRVGGLSEALLQRGFESLGTSFPSAVTWSVRFTPQQHAGVYGLRDLVYDSPCGCFVYTSKVTYSG